MNDTEEQALGQGKPLTQHYDELRTAVEDAYNAGTTMDEAEKLAARCLGASLDIAQELETVDLDARMRKNGVKSMQAKAYMDEIAKHDKKPAEGFLEHAVNLSPLVNIELDAYARAESRRDSLKLHFDIFHEAHVYFRGVSKGSYNP